MPSLTDDPFALLEQPDETEFQQQEPETDSQPAVIPAGSVFVFDLETIPDESRFPRPVRVEKIKRAAAAIDLAKLVTQTVPAIKAKIPTLSEDQLTQLMDLENGMAKPRSGVTDAITNQVAIDNADDHEAAMNEWKKLSFNPFGNRIVALGIRSAKHHVTMLAKTDDEERELLRVLWEHINKFRVRCGYNITAFDDAVLIMRSMLLGVDAPGPISRKKFGDRASIDLMTALFPAGPAQKLKEVCRMIGIVPPAGYEMSGDKVFDLVEAGDWANIAAYVESDAVIEFKLYQWLSEYLVF
ncbi:MAG TPA: hypothetical protein PLY87_16605 [Planctomycetaceae bacterium]|nr:hypothetical protein [Planctomycetaceae bacterium]